MSIREILREKHEVFKNFENYQYFMLNGKKRPGLADGRLRKRVVTPAVRVHASSLFHLPRVGD